MHRLTKLVIMVMISTEPEISIKSLVLSRLKDYLGHTFVIIRSLCPINRNYYSSIETFPPNNCICVDAYVVQPYAFLNPIDGGSGGTDRYCFEPLPVKIYGYLDIY